MNRLRAFAWWFAPLLILLAVYRDTIHIWFREDDFPLLAFLRPVHSWHDFLSIAFVPYAQGTIRPWSERLPFLASASLFGYDCRAFRIVVLATACCDLILINWVTRRVTGSHIAGVAAAALWAVSAAIVSPMTWNASYNEVQYPLFLLGALACFIRYAETGAQRYWWLQFVIFVCGFGSLENIVVYPAVAAAWCMAFSADRKRLKLLAGTLPLFVVSTIYSAVHIHLASLPSEGPYEFRVDARVFKTLREYWRWSFLSPGWEALHYPAHLGHIIFDIAIGGFVLCLAANILKRPRVVWFCIAWFLLTLSLLLPLPNRHTEYYLAVPVMGLCMLAGSALDLAWLAGWKWRLPALVAAGVWCVGMVPVDRGETQHYVEQSRLSRSLLMGVKTARQQHPHEAILLDGITDELYGLDVYENGFEAVGVDQVYLTPESISSLHADPNDGMIRRVVMDPAVARNALDHRQAVVYRFAGDRLGEITSEYTLRSLKYEGATPRHVIVGDPLFAYLLGPEWGGAGNGVRWMPAAAEVLIGGPDKPGEHISLSGYCLQEQLSKGGFELAVYADGMRVGASKVVSPEAEFQRRFVLPDVLVHRNMVRIRIQIDPVIIIGGQPYGALFGEIRIEP